ncbi:MAG TPA: gephyrin-like molybdotransferase Glp [Vicinamibacterales bacterium]|jgi:molybdenum cofactor synthesis domain-containing protein
MRPFGDIISIDAAREIVRTAGTPIERVDRVPLRDAHRRVLAQAIVSPRDVPPFARAAMDGYAVRAIDTAEAGRGSPKALQVVETIYTGDVPTRSVGAGQCSEIATGAPLPPGADAVVMVEDTEPGAEGTVRILAPVAPHQHVGAQGADIRTGQTVLGGGDVLTASRLGAVAAMGFTEVEVFARPRVAILSTGNEIIEPGEPLAPGQLYDVNQFTLAAVVAEHGGVAVPLGTAPDTLAELEAAVEQCLVEDLVVVSGGSSVGERDLILDVVAARGHVHFHGIAVKPGKPTLFGSIKGKPVFGMSGYPTSCLINAYVLIIPVLRRIARLPLYEPRVVSARMARRVSSVAGRHQFLTVRVADGLAHPAFKGSGDITSMSQADGFVEIPASIDSVEEGTIVDVKLF